MTDSGAYGGPGAWDHPFPRTVSAVESLKIAYRKQLETGDPDLVLVIWKLSGDLDTDILIDIWKEVKGL